MVKKGFHWIYYKEKKMKTFKDFRNGTITESPVDGVSKGSLEGDKHMCASKIFKEGHCYNFYSQAWYCNWQRW